MNAKDLIASTKGRIFSVTFRKADGTIRKMVARTGVKRYLKGGENKALASNPALVVVYDVQAKGYRMVNTDTVISMKANKKEYVQ